jgi:predicted transcriptional regulator
MKQTTVKLPDELDAMLRHEAARRGVTVSELTREAIAEYLRVQPRRHLSCAAAGRSGQTDLSVRVEEILREEWGQR